MNSLLVPSGERYGAVAQSENASQPAVAPLLSNV